MDARGVFGPEVVAAVAALIGEDHGKKLDWDGPKMAFTNDEKANKTPAITPHPSAASSGVMRSSPFSQGPSPPRTVSTPSPDPQKPLSVVLQFL